MLARGRSVLYTRENFSVPDFSFIRWENTNLVLWDSPNWLLSSWHTLVKYNNHKISSHDRHRRDHTVTDFWPLWNNATVIRLPWRPKFKDCGAILRVLLVLYFKMSSPPCGFYFAPIFGLSRHAFYLLRAYFGAELSRRPLWVASFWLMWRKRYREQKWWRGLWRTSWHFVGRYLDRVLSFKLSLELYEQGKCFVISAKWSQWQESSAGSAGLHCSTIAHQRCPLSQARPIKPGHYLTYLN